jgi:steroid delta-isomerase
MDDTLDRTKEHVKMKHSKMREVVDRYVAAYKVKDVGAILALYREDATMEDPVGTPPIRGKAAITAFYEAGFGMEVSLELDGHVRCAGNAVAFPLCASTPTAKIYIIDVFEFADDGKVEKMRAYWSPEDVEGEMPV